ncbi:PQQ-binding-like beta-propeller repeat protein [Fibrobacterota bacterium]
MTIVISVCVTALLLSASFVSGQNPASGLADANFDDSTETQYHLLETIRYKHDIEGDLASAKSELQKLLKQTNHAEIKSYLYFFLGKIYDHGLFPDSAVVYYKKAMEEPRISREKLDYIYRRLAGLKPELVESIDHSKTDISRIDKIFPYQTNGQKHYVLQTMYREKSVSDFQRQFAELDNRGRLKKIPLRLENEERLYDFSDGFFLAGGGNYLRAGSLSEGKENNFVFKDGIIDSRILSGRSGDFIVAYAGNLDYFKQGSFQQTIALDGDRCTWHTVEGRTHHGLLLCDDEMVYAVDVEKGSAKNLSNLSGKPYFIKALKDYAVFQFYDHFEVRTGENFQTVQWKANSSLVDKLYMAGNALYVLEEKGTVKCYNTASGQKEWQKELEGKKLFATENEVYLITHYHACLGVGLNGDIKWTYEFGWDKEITSFLSNGYLVLFYVNGDKIRLNLDLMEISDKSRKKRLMDLVENSEKMDPKSGLKFAEKILQQEPGNGLALMFKYLCVKKLQHSDPSQLNALIQAAHSSYTPPWKTSPVLQNLNSVLTSKWIWKRAYGKKYYPNLIAENGNLIYIENNNQTIVVLDADLGQLSGTAHIPEELDSKICLWTNDGILVSSPKRLFLIPYQKGTTGTRNLALDKPVCEAIVTEFGLFISDWFGNLKLLHIPDGFHSGFTWERQIAKNGLLINKVPHQAFLDVIDIQGHFFAVDPETGRILYDMPLPKGIITDIYSRDDRLFAGYDHGLIICFSKAKKEVLWSQNFSDQIFSLDGNDKNLLVITTSAKRLFCVHSITGAIQSEIAIQTSLVNKPALTSEGYWLGTIEPALERRNFSHNLIKKFRLTGLPGNPVLTDSSLFISTLDGFITAFTAF